MTVVWPSRDEPCAMVWLQTGFIGDIVLTTAALELARQIWPERPQWVITTHVGQEILAASPAVRGTVLFDKGQTSLLQSLRQVKGALRRALGAERAVLLQAHLSPRSSLLARGLGLPTLTFAEGAAAFLAQARVPRVAVLHEAQRIGLLLEPLGVTRLEIMSARPALAPRALASEEPWAQRLRAHPGPVVALAPGSVWGTKRWPPSEFAALARLLLEDPRRLLLLLGSPAEAEVAAQVAAQVAAPDRLLNVAGLTKLGDLCALLPRCTLLVANDSSPVHFASALGVPTVALFGATVPGMGFGPLAPQSVALGIDLDCRPCSVHGPMTCPLGHFRCMRGLAADVVWRACERLLGAGTEAFGGVGAVPENPRV